jgi:hypothetical protein
MKKTILILALVGCIAPCVAMAQAAGSVPAGSRVSTEDNRPAHPDAGVAADQGVEALLDLLLRQVLAGQTMAPEGDNAIFTWKRLLKLIVPRSPATTRALTDFVAVSRRRAADEQAAGRTVTAREISIFADEAADMLKSDQPEPHATASAGPVAAPPTQVRRSDAAPAAKPPTAAAEPNGTDALARMASRDSETIQEHSSAAASPPATVPTRPADRQSAPDQAALAAAALSRGDAMLAMKNITAARSLYEYAANAGNARAAAALAETYDPVFLNRLGAIGPRPDPALAAEWYRKAAALGDRSSVARLQTLRADAGK